MFSKIIAIAFIGINSIIGFRFFLNVIHILQTSKYSKTATLIYAILFLLLAGVGIYLLLARGQPKWAILVGLGPWVLIILGMFISMLTGDYK